MLRKYIAYARDNIHPRLDINGEKIATLYAQLRDESLRTGSIAITIRNVEVGSFSPHHRQFPFSR